MATWISIADSAAALKRMAIIAGGLALIVVVWLYLGNTPAMASGAVEGSAAIVSVNDHGPAADDANTCPPNEQKGEEPCHLMASCPVCAATDEVVAGLDYASHYALPRRDQIHPSRVIEPQPQPPQNS